jgi:hypothetical protein
MCLSFNWVRIGSYTNLLYMDSDPYSVPYYPSNLVFHVALNSKIHPYHIFSIYDKVAIFLLPCPSLLHFMPIYRQRTRAVRTRKLKPPLWNVGRIPYQ